MNTVAGLYETMSSFVRNCPATSKVLCHFAFSLAVNERPWAGAYNFREVGE